MARQKQLAAKLNVNSEKVLFTGDLRFNLYTINELFTARNEASRHAIGKTFTGRTCPDGIDTV